MKQKLCMGLCLLGLLTDSGRLFAQISAVQVTENATTVNLQSERGVPISTSANASIGSDGQEPTVDSSGLGNTPTAQQFSVFMSFGAVTATTNNALLRTNNPYLLGTTAFSLTTATNMQLPVGISTNGTFVLRRAWVGAPYVAQTVNYYFGSTITPPNNDFTGNVLTNTSAASYWQPQPYSYGNYNGSNASTAAFYYSPNAEQVFATRSGPISVTWITTGRYASTNLPSYTNQLSTGGVPNYITNTDNSISILYTENYLVSVSPVKAPQNMYWTEGAFANSGYLVQVPAGRISAINVIFNSSFPASVSTPYPNPGSTNALSTQTLWYDNQAGDIHAYNAIGRVFVEMVGAPNGNGTSQYLGFEIVDVAQTPSTVDLTNYLGDVLTPYQDPSQGGSLAPSPINNDLGTEYYFQNGSTYYADKATTAPNELQMYWLTSGVAGLQWPYLFDDYTLVWPSDPSQYSFYLRPVTTNAAEAALTAVQLDAAEAPSIDYQDPLDQTRAFLTPTDGFYTWLTPDYPSLRALLRFNAQGNVRFERVLSMLAQGLQNNAIFAGSVITNLSAWDPTNSTLTNYADGYSPPYVLQQPVNVGDQIPDPSGELGSTNGTYGDYWAGYINTNVNATFVNTNIGTSYDPYAYIDPFANGFTAANMGSIIPVNAIPGHNQLEVWWFRQNNADPSAGFEYVYWPTVIGDYAIQWPSGAPSIILAGNAGSGPLDSLRAAGSIYYQNDPTQPGYNPNEEHALMLGGQAYALRDDLNVTTATNNALPFNGYSSAPAVLVSYSGSDRRPAMSVFNVQREDPAAGIYFDYIVPAGTLLQAPMPLPLMQLPLAANAAAPNGYTNFDTEPASTSGDLPAGWQASDANGPYGWYSAFTFQDRKNNFWVYRGLNAGLPPLQAGAFNTNNNTFGPLPAAVAVVNQPFNYFIHVSRQLDSLTVGLSDLPPGLAYQESTTNGLSITGVPAGTGNYPVTIVITDTADHSQVTLPLSINVVASGTVSALGPLVINSTNQYSGQIDTYSNRPPALAQPAEPSNSFTMRFYYKTLPGFAWPGLGNSNNWPAVGTIVPYLRPLSNGSYVGNPASSNTASLDIVYRPVWPEVQNGQPLPTLAIGQTLTTANDGMAAVRGQDSVQVLYQQSIATNIRTATRTVALYDPTVQKQSSLAAIVTADNGLPPSMLTAANNGVEYFPNLPPNLISRIWYDPNSQNLYFTGQFVSDPVNGNYVMLNVLRGDDLAAVDGLVSTSDPEYAAWKQAVANLSTPEYTFYQNPAQPGSYVINTNLTVTRYAGDLVEVTNSDTAVDSYAMAGTGAGQGYVTYIVANGLNPKYAADPVSVYVVRVATPLFPGALVIANSANASPFGQVVTFEHTSDMAGLTSNYLYDWRIEPPVNGQPPPLGTEANWTQLTQTNPGPVYQFGASGILGLTDNYISMRYGYRATNNGAATTNWSPWANPILAEGWISRVTQAIDPIAGQTQDLFDNAAQTTASLIELAGPRWNGDVPLNSSSITNNGLIQLYETVLDMGESLSINAGINYGPANQSLLLAAGYLNDLYMTLGNAAYANSLNPTIGFGTDNQTYGAVATSSFVFEGEEPTLLQQNLALLRGRDDSVAPGVDLPPVYNRLYWNYTYGLAAGEVIYALNYNITDQNGDGVVNAEDAQIMFPQGHGDAYGHYLTALTEYYKLLLNPNFDWVPQAQTVLILGADVTVNYENESKFAATAAALARTGRQVFDLTWRQDYVPGTAGGWDYMSTNYVGQYPYIDNNGDTQHVTGYWGLDHWASRVGQGTYLNWVVGNSILPYQDPNPDDQGIQVVDRQTVQDLQELPQTAAALEADMDNANAGFTPLGLAQNAIPFDINPNQVTGSDPQTHFQQIYTRAVQALNNAVVAFNAAQNVTQELREQQNSLSDLQASVAAQELAYNDQLIELYGTPYPEDIGPGETYPDGYTGPDLVHYMYVDNPDTNTFNGLIASPATNATFLVDTQNFPTNWYTSVFENWPLVSSFDQSYTSNDYVAINVAANGFFGKPAGWTEERGSIGSIQTAIAAINSAQDQLRQAAADAVSDKQNLDYAVMLVNAQNSTNNAILGLQQSITSEEKQINNTTTGFNIADTVAQDTSSELNTVLNVFSADPLLTSEAIGVGVANGVALAASAVLEGVEAGVVNNYQNDVLGYQQQINTDQYNAGVLNSMQSLAQMENQVQGDVANINQDLVALNGAQANYQALVAQGNRIQQERETFREHTAAQVQGYTVADSAFLVFQNEDLERYNSLFNLAAEYAYMAANAYDYETGLLNTPAGQSYLNQIISSCALGVIQNGQPQISGTDTGDPGLANALAEMYGDWQVLQGRLGFNNPDGYGTIASLRSENYRILSGSAGDSAWQQLLQQSIVSDLRSDSDVLNHCLQIDDGSGQAVPGIELTFSTTITDGENLFGQPLSQGDHAFSSSSFATKIFAVGVCFDGYQGMDNPAGLSAGITSSNLGPNALSATPYVYLIPVGADSMRAPPLGDTSTIRTWNVDDVAIPLPFNIGASDFSSTPFYTSADSLSEPLFAIRKQEAFRPVSTTAAFTPDIYGAGGSLQPTQYANQRLIGRSVWNSKWKLIIPGRTLLSDPYQGMNGFINTVKDVHLYFVTYSYAGN